MQPLARKVCNYGSKHSRHWNLHEVAVHVARVFHYHRPLTYNSKRSDGLWAEVATNMCLLNTARNQLLLYTVWNHNRRTPQVWNKQSITLITCMGCSTDSTNVDLFKNWTKMQNSEGQLSQRKRATLAYELKIHDCCCINTLK